MGKGPAMRRFSSVIVTMTMLVLPAFAAAQHRGSPAASAPAANPSVPAISRAASPSVHATGHPLSRMQSAARPGTLVVRRQNGVRIADLAKNANFNNNANFVFDGTDFQDVPGLGFDYPHLAAIGGNRRSHIGRFADGFAAGFPFGFSGFLLGPSVIEEGMPVAESQIAGAQSSAPDEQEIAGDASPVQRGPHRSRSARRLEPEADSAPAPPGDEEQYVFVRRDGSLVFAVAYAWESETLRYITPDGLRRSIGRDALDLDATRQFNEQRGVNFRAPA